ncbi:MAG TPA: hypothetical protein PKC39_12460 [Ferruginibacter sp.]|nr:hypothetical protein [Ferruginibacter sp.]HMP21763.1 hypothetical protein [Ferruginibacter sp.]
MLKFQNIKVGDYLMGDNDGDVKKGEVTNLQTGAHQVCLDTGAQEFWFEMDQLAPIPLDENEINKLKFTKQVNPDGTVKYMKGAFRIMLPAAGDFSKMEIWYRDEHRHITHPLNVHELQNHFYEMTKVHLNEEVY